MRKGLPEVNDLGKNEDGHKVSLCLECLLECFRAKFAEPAKLNHSAKVSPPKTAAKRQETNDIFHGSIFKGLGTMEGKVLEDPNKELAFPEKKKFA